jgi:nicotinamide-nucleotide amidase
VDLHEDLSQKLGKLLLKRQWVLATAESCTGGGVATAVTEIAGSSQWFDRSFVTYSNEAKMEMLGVELSTLEQFGAVSEQTVLEMVSGTLHHSRANIAVSISGIAGPSGGTAEKPVGTVCFAWATNDGWTTVETHHFSGGRAQVREQAIYHALITLHDYLSDE